MIILLSNIGWALANQSMKVQDIKIACLQFSDLAVDPNPIQCSNVVAENSVQCFFFFGFICVQEDSEGDFNGGRQKLYS